MVVTFEGQKILNQYHPNKIKTISRWRHSGKKVRRPNVGPDMDMELIFLFSLLCWQIE